MNNLAIYLGLYMATLLGIAYFAGRKETKEDFLISGRNRSSLQIFLSKFAGSIGATWLVTYTAYAYRFGLATYGTLAGFLIGYIVFAYWAVPRIYKDSREKKFYTQGDYVFHQTGSRVCKLVTNYIAIIVQLCWMLAGVIGGAKIMAHFGLFSYEVAVLTTSLVVLSYILFAGFKAVIITDIFQAIIIAILLVLISTQATATASITEILNVEFEKIDIGLVIGLLVYGFGSVFVVADRYQLCYSAKDTKSIQKGIGYAIIPILVAAGFLMMVGMFMKLQDPAMPDIDLVLIEALKSYLPAAFIPFGVLLFFAGLMSSIDTNIYTIASHHTLSQTSSNQVNKVRISSLLIVCFSIAVAFLYRDVVGLTLIGGAITLAMAGPMIYIIKGGKNPQKFLSGIIFSIIAIIIWYLMVK